MLEDKDMVEINLNTTQNSKAEGKQTNYFGNIHFAKAHNNGFPYGHFDNVKVDNGKTSILNSKFFNFNDLRLHNFKIKNTQHTAAAEKPAEELNCIRQMYCPDCEQRLDEDVLRYDKFLNCCSLLMPFNCIKQHWNRRLVCSKCGANLGYWKQS